MTESIENPTDDEHTRILGTIGETEVRIVADGPKAQWCADVLAAKFERTFEAVSAHVANLNETEDT